MEISKQIVLISDDVLKNSYVHSVISEESLSKSYTHKISLLLFNNSILLTDIIGKEYVIAIDNSFGSDYKYFHGVATNASIKNNFEKQCLEIEMELKPNFWLLSYKKDCRIFQNLTVREIISQIFDENFIQHYEWRVGISGDRILEYSVQYNETTYDFVNRILEDSGIYYYFEQDHSKNVCIFCDSFSQQDLVKYNNGEISYLPTSSNILCNEDAITEIEYNESTTTTSVSLKDYSFQKPNANMVAESSINSSSEFFIYPANRNTENELMESSESNLESILALSKQIKCKSTCKFINSGYLFKTYASELDCLENEFYILSIVHTAKQSVNTRTLNTKEAHESYSGYMYENSFIAIPKSLQFRPNKKTHIPSINSLQTATVVGKNGEQIWTDALGRIKVKFHWDRHNSANEKASCWIRVAQMQSGNKWGHTFIPRTGQEVLVAFLDGNPDRPIIVGTVSNATHNTSYKLPESKTRSVIRSQSLSGKGFNEISFEDAANKEEIFIHAHKNLNEEVQNNHYTTVLGNQINNVSNDRNVNVDGSQISIVKGDHSSFIYGNHRSTIEKNSDLMIKGDLQEIIEANKTVCVAGDQSEFISGSSLQMVTGNNSKKVEGDDSDSTQGHRITHTNKTHHISSLDNFTISSDKHIKIYNAISKNSPLLALSEDSVVIDVGEDNKICISDKCVIISSKEVFITTGDSKIHMTESALTIKSGKIELN